MNEDFRIKETLNLPTGIHEHDWPEETPIVHSIPFDDETDHVYRASICTCGAINGWWEARKR